MKRGRDKRGRLGIVVGGGPAPGINGVIRSATIEAINSGEEVIGIFDGFQGLMEGKTNGIMPLGIEDVSRIHFMGGSLLRSSRANPTKSRDKMKRVVRSLRKLRIDRLITIGGDDTAFTAYRLEQEGGGAIRVAHVPKTIDNDLPLPGLMPTFGFHTARHYGMEIMQALMEDARSTSRWYFVIAMGRKAGHLALGIGKAAGATLILIPEEFGRRVSLASVCDVLEGAIIKRTAMGRMDGVAVIAEGISEKIGVGELSPHATLMRDPHGHIRLEEIDLGKILKNEIMGRFAKRGAQREIVSKNIGYELRCMPPVPFDCEYTQDLGYAAVRFLLSGGSGAIVTIKRGGKTDPIPLHELLDVTTGRLGVRLVDVESDSYQVARKYMIRLERKDFDDPRWVKKMAATANMSASAFRKRFFRNL